MIERKIDELGRIVIPFEMRKELGVSSDSVVTFEITNENELTMKVINKFSKKPENINQPFVCKIKQA